MSKKKKRKATKLSTVTYLRRMLCNSTGFAIKHKAKKLALFWITLNYQLLLFNRYRITCSATSNRMNNYLLCRMVPGVKNLQVGLQTYSGKLKET